MQSFAIYRMPEQKTCTLVRQHDRGCRILRGYGDIDGLQGFAIMPFGIDSDHPAVFIEGEIVTGHDPEDELGHDVRELLNDAHVLPDPGMSSTREAYDRDFAAMHERLRSGIVDKVVLTRSVTVPVTAPIDRAAMFVEACHRFPHCYVAMFSTPATGTWLVASPELLLSLHDGHGATIALAGTMTRDEFTGQWSDKNRWEQAIVSDHIRHVLEPMADAVTVSGPATVQAAHLVHLRTDFSFGLRTGVGAAPLIDALHPTPAVCGSPKHEARQLITDVERTSRGYYCGFSGPYNGTDATDLYVTLRCMQICDSSCRLYAGGGLVNGSDAESEWTETEQKLKPMKTVIRNVQ